MNFEKLVEIAAMQDFVANTLIEEGPTFFGKELDKIIKKGQAISLAEKDADVFSIEMASIVTRLEILTIALTAKDNRNKPKNFTKIRKLLLDAVNDIEKLER